jgi:hypothetical protein
MARTTGARPTSRLLYALCAAAVFAAAALAACAGGATAQQARAYGSAQAAIDNGLEAYQAGQREAAIAALSEADAHGDASEKFVAEFYLARIYSQTFGEADHTRAFVLYRKLADENLNVDPETNRRAPFVAKALIALAGYVRAGVKEIDLKPSPARAIAYLHHAAVFFGDKDAQFELARIYLGADPRGGDVRLGLHYLSALTEDGYAPAQAMLADLFWRGHHVNKDERRALALATIATEAAPPHERIWIEDTYATIFCASTPAARVDAGRLVTLWRKMFAAPEPSARLATRELLPGRQCANGENVALAPPATADQLASPPAGFGLLKGAVAPAPAPAPVLRAGIVEAAAGRKAAPTPADAVR